MPAPTDHPAGRRLVRRSMTVLAAALMAAGTTVGQQEQPAPGAAYRQANRVAVLTVHEDISRHTLRSLERRVEQALDDGADAIVLDIDTPGGELTATLDICHLLKTDAPANTVAWINPQAYSAGTIIALACREIVVAPNATFGDAAPIQAGPFGLAPLGPAERAKVESPILEEVVDSARRHHYDENLVQAFVSVGVELWMLENVSTGERIFVDRAEYESVFDEEPPTRQTPVAPPAAPAAGADQTPVRPWINPLVTPERRGEDAEQIEQFVKSLAPIRPPLTSADRADWRLVDQVIASDRLLTVKERQAIFYGLARQTIANERELTAYFGASSVVRYDRSWSEMLVRFVTHPLVMGVLIIVFIVGLVGELASPGLGVFGGMSLTALLLLVGGPYLAGMAQWWDILLIVVGILLVAAELFIIPGLGVAGILGAVSLLAGLVGLFVTSDLGSAEGQGQLATGLVTTLAGIFAAGIGVWLI
ncbi:MAG: NfeD family protein, partial [Planctomycetota bacterium]